MMLKTSHMCRSIVMMAVIMIMMMSTSDMYRLPYFHKNGDNTETCFKIEHYCKCNYNNHPRDMSSMEVDERGRQFDATLDVDHSGVAERRFKQKFIFIFLFFLNQGLLNDFCLEIAITITNMIKRESLIIVAGSFCSSLL